MSNEKCIKQLEASCFVQGSKERRNNPALIDRKFYILSVGWPIHMHAWAQSQGGELPWRRTSGYSSSVKTVQNLLYRVTGWRNAALNRLIYRV